MLKLIKRLPKIAKIAKWKSARLMKKIACMMKRSKRVIMMKENWMLWSKQDT